jgi:progranulin
VGSSIGGATYQTEVFLPTIVNGFGLGPCVAGWSTCAQSLAGGCCPSGFDCGTVSCVEGASVVGKEAPNGAPAGKIVERMGWVFVCLGIVAGTIMVLL